MNIRTQGPAAVEDHNGQIARFMGDGFKAVFGTPIARENDPEMAIRAGLDILVKAQDYARILAEKWGFGKFQVRVGINTGLVALGGMTEAEDTAMGSAVNLAKRIESEAPPGGLLISHNTYRHVSEVFDVEQKLPIEAKGFREPVPVYRVLRVKPRALRVRTMGVEGVETRMVGRKAELLELQGLYQQAMEAGVTQSATLVGEAGVGKSRLLYEFQHWLELLQERQLIFQGYGRQETQQRPYTLLRDLFALQFEIKDSDQVSEVRTKLEMGFGKALGTGKLGKMKAHILGQLFGHDFRDSPLLEGILEDPQQLRDRGLVYLGEYFQKMSESAPTVVFLEDIHWADGSSLDLLTNLTRKLPDNRLLFIFLTRQRLFDRHPGWGEDILKHTQLDLQPLSQQDCRSLVEEILKLAEHIPDNLLELVGDNAEGNPFYVEELIKMLIEDGVIVTGEEHWRVEPPRLAEIKVPATLTSVLQARLDSLPEIERETLQQASVVGRTFWDRIVERIHASAGKETEKQEVLKALLALQGREMVYQQARSAFADAQEYLFKHAVLREVTYESVLLRLRRIYHGLVADWLIEHTQERADEYTGLIADNLELAGRMDQAILYMQRAGEQAGNAYANAEAVAYFSRALALTQEEDLTTRFDLLLAREKVLHIQGQREAQKVDLSALEKVAAALNDPGKQTQVAYRQMVYHKSVSDYGFTEEVAVRAIQLARAAGEVECEAKIHVQWWDALMTKGEYQAAFPLVERALKLAQQHDLQRVEVNSLRLQGICYLRIGDASQCKRLFLESLEKAIQIGDRRLEAASLGSLGAYTYIVEGDYQKSKDYYQQSIRINQQIGNRSGEAWRLINLSFVTRFTYDFNQALEYLSQSLAIHCEIDNPLGESEAYEQIAWVYFQTGEYEKFIEYFNLAFNLKQQIDLEDDVDYMLGVFTWVYGYFGDFKRADGYYERLRPKWQQMEDRSVKSLIAVNLGAYLHYKRDNQAAMDYLREVVPADEVNENVLFEWFRLTAMGLGLTGLGELDEAKEVYQQAVNLGHQMKLKRHELEAQAGLARVYLAQGELELAFTQAEDILAYMEENKSPKGSSHCLDGTDDPFHTYLTCYKVLKANNDPRVQTVIVDAYDLLQKRADNIYDEHLRQCFLENVAVNREIVTQYEREVARL